MAGFAGLLVGSTIITVIKYAAIPLLFALLRKKPMHFLVYDLICYALNFLILFFTYMYHTSGRVNTTPYYLWTTIFTCIGHTILYKKGLFKKKEKTLSNETSSVAEVKNNFSQSAVNSSQVSELPNRTSVVNNASIEKNQDDISSTEAEEEEDMFSPENEMQIIEVLSKYGELVKSGLLTEEEFNRKKEELLWKGPAKAAKSEISSPAPSSKQVPTQPEKPIIKYGVNPRGEKAVFFIRTSTGRALCPVCNTEQPIDRHKCLKCGTPFMYEFSYDDLDIGTRNRLVTFLEYCSGIDAPINIKEELKGFRSEDNKIIIDKLLNAQDDELKALCKVEARKIKESLMSDSESKSSSSKSSDFTAIPPRKTIVCPNCGETVSASEMYCVICGYQIH